jgi:hypothetical protein
MTYKKIDCINTLIDQDLEFNETEDKIKVTVLGDTDLTIIFSFIWDKKEKSFDVLINNKLLQTHTNKNFSIFLNVINNVKEIFGGK